MEVGRDNIICIVCICGMGGVGKNKHSERGVYGMGLRLFKHIPENLLSGLKTNLLFDDDKGGERRKQVGQGVQHEGCFQERERGKVTLYCLSSLYFLLMF